MKPAPDKIFLNSPIEDKDQLKKLGARWDVQERGWWISATADRALFDRWLPGMYRPNRKPPHILTELVPAPSWYINLRSLLPQEEWTRLRKECSRNVGHRCVVCGGKGHNWPVECNEQWSYIEDPITPGVGIQKLLRLVALCPPCHWTKHLGKARIEGRLMEALEQLCFVNGWTMEEAQDHAEEAFEIWEDRNSVEWRFDLSLLPELGIHSIILDEYEFEPVPIIDGVKVELLRRLANLFEEAARL